MDMNGYKATDRDMKCRGVQFVLREWSEPISGDLIECQNGYHFCEQPSGVWAYYEKPGTRVFKVKCRDVLEKPAEPGVNTKRVCRQIMLVEEVVFDSDRNTGNRNTGNCNTGNRNTGNHNAGDCNTGDCNTGNCNTGECNTGNCNTGDRNTGNHNAGNCNTGNHNAGNYNTGNHNAGNCNTGNYNTGNRNAGDCNAGDCNTGDRNAGDCNTGNYNAGDCNTTDRCSGVFCQKEQTVRCFDIDTKLTYELFTTTYGTAYNQLADLLMSDKAISDVSAISSLPGFTKKKLKSLHEKMIKARTDSK